MPRSLEEIQAEVESKKGIQIKRKPNKMTLVSDAMFVFALAMMAMCAIILFYGESGGDVNEMYEFVNANRDITLVVFAVLIVFSFFLRFFAQKEERKE
jgi:hypothetical protein